MYCNWRACCIQHYVHSTEEIFCHNSETNTSEFFKNLGRNLSSLFTEVGNVQRHCNNNYDFQCLPICYGSWVYLWFNSALIKWLQIRKYAHHNNRLNHSVLLTVCFIYDFENNNAKMLPVHNFLKKNTLAPNYFMFHVIFRRT